MLKTECEQFKFFVRGGHTLELFVRQAVGGGERTSRLAAFKAEVTVLFPHIASDQLSWHSTPKKPRVD